MALAESYRARVCAAYENNNEDKYVMNGPGDGVISFRKRSREEENWRGGILYAGIYLEEKTPFGADISK